MIGGAAFGATTFDGPDPDAAGAALRFLAVTVADADLVRRPGQADPYRGTAARLAGAAAPAVSGADVVRLGGRADPYRATARRV